MGRKLSQLSLFDDGSQAHEEAPTGETKKQRSPIFWIEEVRLLRSLSTAPNQQIRRIELRRGMNIIWAPPLENDDLDQRFSGHAAGKTSFCRLLRYVLGEPKPGSNFLRERLQARLPRAWVVARVWINDKPWVIARPLAGRRRSICAQTEDLDAWLKSKPTAEADDFEIFRVTLHQAVIEQLPVKSFGDSGQSIRFLHLLAWLTRDQECRLDGLLSWRHKDSQSASPTISADDRRFLVRSVVGVMDQEIRQEMEYRTSLETDFKRLPTEIAFRQRTVEEAIQALKPFTDDAHDSIADPLFATGIERQLRAEEQRELDALKPQGVLTIEEQRVALDRAHESLGAAKYAMAIWENDPCGVASDLAHKHCPFHVDAPDPIPRKGALVTQNRKMDAERALKQTTARVQELQESYGTSTNAFAATTAASMSTSNEPPPHRHRSKPSSTCVTTSRARSKHHKNVRTPCNDAGIAKLRALPPSTGKR
jgi:hypothetical protein